LIVVGGAVRRTNVKFQDCWKLDVRVRSLYYEVARA
jgi:hypothetical protein